MKKSIAAVVTSCSVLAFSLVSLPGCSDDGFGKRYPVSGTVKYKGEDVKAGNINFIPAEDNTNLRAAQGEISDGYYQLTTASPNDGAMPGKFKVTVISVDADYSKVMERSQKEGGAGRQEDVYKANKGAKKLVPSKYSIPQTSPLEKTVKEESNTFDFDLED